MTFTTLFLGGFIPMSKRLFVIAMGCCSFAVADEGVSVAENETLFVTPVEVTTSLEATPIATQEKPAATPAPIVIEKAVTPFTGKVKKNKVRLRTGADLDSKVVKELGKSDLLIVKAEKGEFYAVEPPQGTKAYIFRSFVLDGVVEGNRVNVRLEPSLEAPVIAHLNTGDHIKGVISSLNNKWYEIPPPTDARFYVAKEFVDFLGGPEVKEQFDKRKMAAEHLLDSAALLTKAELQKPFKEISLEPIKRSYETVIHDYTDFSELVDRAKVSLASLQEDYLQKKLVVLGEEGEQAFASMSEAAISPTDRMKLWTPVEESLFLSWSARNDDRSMDEFYEEQKQNAIAVTGIVEPYATPVKKKPGDFILRDKDLPVGYIYSTHINLADYVGKKVTILAAPRTNNNFAFPAYYVLSVQ
jgi:hypothetical protein